MPTNETQNQTQTKIRAHPRNTRAHLRSRRVGEAEDALAPARHAATSTPSSTAAAPASSPRSVPS